AGAMSADGSREFGTHTVLTRAEQGADAVVARIAGMIHAVIEQTIAETGATRDAFLGVGIGSPGPLDRAKGIVITTPNLGWQDFPLRDRVSEAAGLPATLDNDANCANLGEWCGVAGGLVLNGELYRGSSDVAGEVGHTTIDSTGRRCKCGNYGCLEAYASGPAIAERAREGLAGGG